MIPNNEYTANEFLDAHSTYQPLIQRFSMGNIYPSSKSSVESGRCNVEQAPQVVLTGTKGLLFFNILYSRFEFNCFVFCLNLVSLLCLGFVQLLSKLTHFHIPLYLFFMSHDLTNYLQLLH